MQILMLFDGIIKSCKHYEGQNSTKWLKELGLKLPKMMRDMFVGLCNHTNWDMDKMNKIETIGYIHGDLPAAVWRSKMRVTRTMRLLHHTEKMMLLVF
ncbi:unnamed protein product [Rhizophagus irregularis]|nr:unnamed protein product [Rhizophagus irregularis]